MLRIKIRWRLISWNVKKILKMIKIKNNGSIMQSKRSVYRIKKSRFAEEQEAKGLLSNLGMKNLWVKFHC